MAEGGLSERARQRAAELANEVDIRMLESTSGGHDGNLVKSFLSPW